MCKHLQYYKQNYITKLSSCIYQCPYPKDQVQFPVSMYEVILVALVLLVPLVELVSVMRSAGDGQASWKVNSGRLRVEALTVSLNLRISCRMFKSRLNERRSGGVVSSV